jgi:hypothetical protein
MAATNEAILLGNDTQVVDLHKDPPPPNTTMMTSNPFKIISIVSSKISHLTGRDRFHFAAMSFTIMIRFMNKYWKILLQ